MPELHASKGGQRQYCFGEFTLDLGRGFLRKGSEEVALRPQAFEVLTYLVQHHGRLVPKEELFGSVWPETVVTDNALAQCLAEIRRALGVESEDMIRTVARRGYVFQAPVTTPIGEASVVLPQLVSPPVWTRFGWKSIAGASVALAAVAGGLLAFRIAHPAKKAAVYTQITDFTESAVAPALSPNGLMVAFIRGDDAFLTTNQIYVKILPHGEAHRLTDDPRPKYSLAFSPDGSQIAYTTYDRSGWSAFTISPLGGEPRLLLSNAAGVTWLDERQLLFSQVKRGQHMGIVTGTETRAAFRELYFPEHERGMAHYSFASPNRKWALVVEMDEKPVWMPCRLISLDSASQSRQVGPKGPCTSAGWSPDGALMYFVAELEGKRHVWRQRFPNGQPEQLTSGPTEETGLAVAPDGRSLITSIGAHASAIWIHDGQGERALSSEGKVAWVFGSVSFPSFARDGKLLYYLLQRESMGSGPELWRVDVDSGKSEAMLRGVSMVEYNVSKDGRQVIYTTLPSSRESQLWLAPLDRTSPPRRIGSAGDNSPCFGPNGQILYRLTDGKWNYLCRMNQDGSGRSKVVSYPISNIQAVSPGRRWVIAITPFLDGSPGVATMAVPAEGGAPRRLCPRFCSVAWSPDGKSLYICNSPGRYLVIPVGPGETLPDLPLSVIDPLADAASIPGARVLEQKEEITPGLDPSIFVYVRTTVHRNLFRIGLP